MLRSSQILTVHVAFMFVLNKSVAARFSRVDIVGKNNLLDRPVGLEFSSQLGLRGVVVLKSKEHENIENEENLIKTYDTSNEKCFERIFGQ